MVRRTTLNAMLRDGVLLNRPSGLRGERLVNVRHDTSSSNGRFYKQVKFLISPDGELQVTRCYTFNFEIAGSVSWWARV